MWSLSGLFLVAVALRATSLPAVGRDWVGYCLPQSQLQLGGVELGMSTARVRQILGSPVSSKRDSSEDDGGWYPVIHLRYRDLLVDMGRGHVELLATTSQNVHHPSGVRVGMSLPRIGALLHMARPGATLARVQAVECTSHRSPDVRMTGHLPKRLKPTGRGGTQ